MRGGAAVARRSHKPKVEGSNPSPVPTFAGLTRSSEPELRPTVSAGALTEEMLEAEHRRAQEDAAEIRFSVERGVAPDIYNAP